MILKKLTKDEKEQFDLLIKSIEKPGKKLSPASLDKIQHNFFGSNYGSNEEMISGGLSFFGTLPMEDLYHRTHKKEYKNLSPKSKTIIEKKYNKILKLCEHLYHASILFKDADVKEFYKYHSKKYKRVKEGGFLSLSEKFIEQLCNQAEKLRVITSQRRNDTGKPSNENFYNYVHIIAKMYEEVTNEKFTIDRHLGTDGEEEGKFLAVTPGHKFVCQAVLWIEKKYNEEHFTNLSHTDKNIYNACENARKRISINSGT